VLLSLHMFLGISNLWHMWERFSPIYISKFWLYFQFGVNIEVNIFPLLSWGLFSICKWCGRSHLIVTPFTLVVGVYFQLQILWEISLTLCLNCKFVFSIINFFRCFTNPLDVYH
jgi:hypothetical protein